MIRTAISAKTGLAALLLVLLAGCATPYDRRSDGSYHERNAAPAVSVVYVDPLVYPYWSLDYFYFSRHYYPYSIVVQRYDPWYYPFPGWYYGYYPGPGAYIRPGYRSYYPWQRHAHYAHYRPWWVDNRFAFGYRYEPGLPRVRQLDSRLSDLQTSRSLAIRSQRPDRRALLVPATSPVLPATSRRPAMTEQQAVRSSPDGRSSPAANRPDRSHHEQVIERLQRTTRAPGREAPPTRSQTAPAGRVPAARRQREAIELPSRLQTAPAPRISEPPRVPAQGITVPPAGSPLERSQSSPIDPGTRNRTTPPAQQRVTPPPPERRASPPPPVPPAVREPRRERSSPPPVRIPERQTPRSTPSRSRGNDRDRQVLFLEPGTELIKVYSASKIG